MHGQVFVKKKTLEREEGGEKEKEEEIQEEAEKVFVALKNWNVRSAYYKSTE